MKQDITIHAMYILIDDGHKGLVELIVHFNGFCCILYNVEGLPRKVAFLFLHLRFQEVCK